MKVNVDGVWYDSEVTPIQLQLSEADKENIYSMEPHMFNYVAFPYKMKWDDAKLQLKLTT